jgi:hypothetical protein
MRGVDKNALVRFVKMSVEVSCVEDIRQFASTVLSIWSKVCIKVVDGLKFRVTWSRLMGVRALDLNSYRAFRARVLQERQEV